MVNSCIQCQKSKINKHNKSILQTFNIPDKRFQHINIDLVGPLPSSNGNRYCLTCIDRFSSWPAAVPIEDMTSETVAKALLNNWICIFGAPHTITTDQGRQFESKLFKELSKLCGTTHLRTTAYHPQANGMIERFHRALKTALKSYNSTNWTENLPLILLGLRATFKIDINSTPAEMLFGTTLKLPGDFFETSNNEFKTTNFAQNLRDTMEKIKPVPAANHSINKIFIQPELKHCTHIF